MEDGHHFVPFLAASGCAVSIQGVAMRCKSIVPFVAAAAMYGPQSLRGFLSGQQPFLQYSCGNSDEGRSQLCQCDRVHVLAQFRGKSSVSDLPANQQSLHPPASSGWLQSPQQRLNPYPEMPCVASSLFFAPTEAHWDVAKKHHPQAIDGAIEVLRKRAVGQGEWQTM